MAVKTKKRASKAPAKPARAPMFGTLRQANLLLAFGLELAMLAGLALAGWTLPGASWLRGLAALGAVAVAIALWAVWAAPRSERRLAGGALIGFKIALFALATAAWWLAGHPFIAAIFAVLAAINLAAAWAFRQI